MRKLLILIVVLGMAASAYAGFTISVHEMDGVTEYNGRDLQPTEYLWLDIDATSAAPAEYAYWALVVESAEGTITGGAVPAQPPAGSQNVVDAWNAVGYYFYPYVPLTSTQLGVSGNIADAGGAILNGLQIDEILFHCAGGDDAVVNLYMTPTYAAGTYRLEDSVIINQIPEPMTMALLGLGGLLLRRRK